MRIKHILLWGTLSVLTRLVKTPSEALVKNIFELCTTDCNGRVNVGSVAPGNTNGFCGAVKHLVGSAHRGPVGSPLPRHAELMSHIHKRTKFSSIQGHSNTDHRRPSCRAKAKHACLPRIPGWSVRCGFMLPPLTSALLRAYFEV